MPSMRKKIGQEKQKKRGGEKEKSKSQECCVTFKPCASTACDIISYNGHGQLVAAINKLVQSEEIFQTIPE